MMANLQTPVVRILRQENNDFQISLGYRVRTLVESISIQAYLGLPPGT